MNKLTDEEKIFLAKMLGFENYQGDLVKQTVQGTVVVDLKEFNPEHIDGAKYLRDVLNKLSFREILDLHPYAYSAETGWKNLLIWVVNNPYEVCKAILKVKGF